MWLEAVHLFLACFVPALFQGCSAAGQHPTDPGHVGSQQPNYAGELLPGPGQGCAHLREKQHLAGWHERNAGEDVDASQWCGGGWGGGGENSVAGLVGEARMRLFSIAVEDVATNEGHQTRDIVTLLALPKQELYPQAAAHAAFVMGRLLLALLLLLLSVMWLGFWFCQLLLLLLLGVHFGIIACLSGMDAVKDKRRLHVLLLVMLLGHFVLCLGCCFCCFCCSYNNCTATAVLLYR